MLHKTRVWGEPVAVTLDEFAEKVTGSTWTNCTAWKVGPYVFVNDATGGDGAQEYAVLFRTAEGEWWQIESWTCSWMTPDELRRHYRKLPAVPGMYWRKVEPMFVAHVTCPACA
jgi:hypothetical protein